MNVVHNHKAIVKTRFNITTRRGFYKINIKFWSIHMDTEHHDYLCGPRSQTALQQIRTRRAVHKHDNYTKIMGHLNSQVGFWALAFASLSLAELAPRTTG